MKSIDAVIEEYRKRMFIIAKENGIDSHRTLIASQNLDLLLNIKMSEDQKNVLDKKY
ncbi:aspartyl-phosphate phosphatase Spo0E family protein [uncultured Metabacillus sp.]|uniref:aspartyl-phosphate phosphatase Spo0E family protein n=1 Tax=Metabacillus sp. Hm71 TaxID=3450743 RepID=UPI00260D6359|nr:aspartyl-phosphate phosphatase Spo0E family protein [uncultured Metabacillus sp.]